MTIQPRLCIRKSITTWKCCKMHRYTTFLSLTVAVLR